MFNGTLTHTSKYLALLSLSLKCQCSTWGQTWNTSPSLTICHDSTCTAMPWGSGQEFLTQQTGVGLTQKTKAWLVLGPEGTLGSEVGCQGGILSADQSRGVRALKPFGGLLSAGWRGVMGGAGLGLGVCVCLELTNGPGASNINKLLWEPSPGSGKGKETVSRF